MSLWHSHSIKMLPCFLDCQSLWKSIQFYDAFYVIPPQFVFQSSIHPPTNQGTVSPPLEAPSTHRQSLTRHPSLIQIFFIPRPILVLSSVQWTEGGSHSLTCACNEFSRQRQVGSSRAIAGTQGGGKHGGSQTQHCAQFAPREKYRSVFPLPGFVQCNLNIVLQCVAAKPNILPSLSAGNKDWQFITRQEVGER